MWKVAVSLAFAALLVNQGVAEAYMGPGLGAGVIGALLGIVGAVLLGVFAVIYYPIKRVLKQKRRAAQGAGEEPEKPPI